MLSKNEFKIWWKKKYHIWGILVSYTTVMGINSSGYGSKKV
jgi:hypothetical protein